MEKIKFNDILADITNINLVILGLSISIFTVVYSFLINKKQNLIELTHNEKLNGSSPKQKQMKYFHKKYTKRYMIINNHFINMAIISFVFFIASFILNRFIFNELSTPYKILFWALVLLTFILVLYFIAIFIKVLIDYRKDIII